MLLPAPTCVHLTLAPKGKRTAYANAIVGIREDPPEQQEPQNPASPQEAGTMPGAQAPCECENCVAGRLGAAQAQRQEAQVQQSARSTAGVAQLQPAGGEGSQLGKRAV